VISPHTVRDTATLNGANPSAVTVTLSGSAAYTSATSYVCVANGVAVASAMAVSNVSGTSFTITSSGKAESGAVGFVCTGN
jgi:hypothetical protein